ncbi:uncharacterized protein DEA37_0002644 [Paragonimus westermani]|uniref:Uncharacterized protein n=1 Tax=Paragonimus westermani TaxID=34504 RepID=A0A5J4N8Q0_9TREM|nr:uncharacterized protein DEA37_0002644 [Paragonimus westermani]
MAKLALEYRLLLAPIPATFVWFQSLKSNQRVLIAILLVFYLINITLITAALVLDQYALHEFNLDTNLSIESSPQITLRIAHGLWREHASILTVNSHLKKSMQLEESRKVINSHPSFSPILTSWEVCRKLSPVVSSLNSFGRLCLMCSLGILLCHVFTFFLFRKTFLILNMYATIYAVLAFTILFTYIRQSSRCVETTLKQLEKQLVFNSTCQLNGLSFVFLMVVAFLFIPMLLLTCLLIFTYPNNL